MSAHAETSWLDPTRAVTHLWFVSRTLRTFFRSAVWDLAAAGDEVADLNQAKAQPGSSGRRSRMESMKTWLPHDIAPLWKHNYANKCPWRVGIKERFSGGFRQTLQITAWTELRCGPRGGSCQPANSEGSYRETVAGWEITRSHKGPPR